MKPTKIRHYASKVLKTTKKAVDDIDTKRKEVVSRFDPGDLENVGKAVKAARQSGTLAPVSSSMKRRHVKDTQALEEAKRKAKVGYDRKPSDYNLR